MRVGMATEDLNRVRAGFDAHNRGDIDALVELYDPDCVFETLLLGTHRGREALHALYAENQRTLGGYTIEPVELTEIGDKVLAVVQTVGDGARSEISVDDEFAFLFTMSNGRVIREQAFRNREEALAAAG